MMMSDVSATFTSVYPYSTAFTNDAGYVYEIIVSNRSAGEIVVDELSIIMGFGIFGHPTENSTFVFSLNGETPALVSAIARADGDTLSHTTQIRIGFPINTAPQKKLLMPDQDMVLRMTCPVAYGSFQVEVENSIQIANVPA
jgi:hypothetical protein